MTIENRLKALEARMAGIALQQQRLLPPTGMPNGVLSFGSNGPEWRASASQGVSVAALGGVGDGEADDTGALQEAIDLAQGGPVFLGRGSWRFTKPLRFTNSTTRLVGAAPGATRLLYRGDPDADAITFARYDDTTARSCFGCGLRHLTLEGNGRGVGSGDGVSLQGTLFASLEDVEVFNFGGGGVSMKDNIEHPEGYAPLQTILRNVVCFYNGIGYRIDYATTGTFYSCHAQNNDVNIRMRQAGMMHFHGGAFQGAVDYNVLFQPVAANHISQISFTGVHFEAASDNATVYMRPADSAPNNQGCTYIAFRNCWIASVTGQPYFDLERCGEFLIDHCHTGGATGIRLRAFGIDPLRVYGGTIAGVGRGGDQSEFYDITSSRTIWMGGADANGDAIAIGTTAPLHGTVATKFHEPE